MCGYFEAEVLRLFLRLFLRPEGGARHVPDDELNSVHEFEGMHDDELVQALFVEVYHFRCVVQPVQLQTKKTRHVFRKHFIQKGARVSRVASCCSFVLKTQI